MNTKQQKDLLFLVNDAVQLRNSPNVATIQQSGKVGTVRYYQRGGETYVRSAHNAVKTNPRTDAQMLQRLQFASRAALWSAMKGNLKNGFTTKSGSQSDFNVFMKLNDGRGVYFTKSQMAKGAQVIFPIQITDGRLESIVSEKSSDRIKSNIALGSLTLSATTTVNELATAVVANNADFEYGDEIAFISILQSVNSESIPKIKANFYRVVLTKGDSRKVHDLVSADGFQTVSGYLGTNAEMPVGCFAYVHSRRDSKLLVSSQVLVNNNAAIISTYTSDEQYILARDSYGTSEDLFLDPGSSAAASSETTFYTISVGLASGCTSEMGSVTGGGSYEAGSSAVIKATPNVGYVFSKWDDDNTSAERTITVNADHEYKALFAVDSENNATVTLNVPASQQAMGQVRIDGGTLGSTATKTVTKNTEVVINAVPISGDYRFAGWSDGNSDAARTLTITEDLTLSASFESAE